MIALEVSSASGRSSHGGIPAAIRNNVRALLRLDPSTDYALCYRPSRWRKGHLLRPDAGNARLRVIQDPLNALLLRGCRLLHAMATWLPRTPRVPKLVTIYDLNAVRNTQWVRPEWHERRSARIAEAIARADRVVATSGFIAGELREEYRLPDDRVAVVPLGVDAERFAPPPGEAIEAMRARFGDYVLAIGLLTPRKNFPRLIEAVSRLERNVRLVLVGRASDGADDVERALDRCGMRERVARLEGIPEAELIALLAAARVYAVPSLYEGFGLTVLEGMAAGVPVVCSDAASLPEAAGGAACLVDATDVGALHAGLAGVLEDPERAEALRRRGLERARTCSWDAAARQLRALYRDVAGV